MFRKLLLTAALSAIRIALPGGREEGLVRHPGGSRINGRRQQRVTDDLRQVKVIVDQASQDTVIVDMRLFIQRSEVVDPTEHLDARCSVPKPSPGAIAETT